MSTTIDQRVVEMRFDNKQFEAGVSDTLSTLDKLKKGLNLTGATKGLEEVSSAAKKIDLSGVGNAVETVQAKFSALQVMAVTALANITNSAVNAGKRIVSALTIDPIKTGFSEYETKINAIQTIMSNTASKGTTMSDVTRVINELNTYADKTIYNFAEMTKNIGTFTAAGVGLEDSAAAIQGIANLAAASGSTSQQASTAMYQLSQALAAGQVKLMDWNSVVNAGMGGEKFQEALKATAREHGIAVDAIIKEQGSFRESLQRGWITADVLNETLKKFTVEGAQEYAQSMLKSGKYTQAQADALIKEARAMEDAATKVKTLTQLWDTMKESAQSGWGQTWETIVGDFEEAKVLFTEISDVMGGVISASADARNELITGAFTSSWEKLSVKIGDAGISADDFNKKIKELAKAKGYDVDKLLESYGNLGDLFATGELPIEILTKSFDKLSDSQLTNIGITDKFGKKLTEVAKSNGYDVEKLLKSYGSLEDLFGTGEIEADILTKTLNGLSDAQIISMGYTEDQVKQLRSLAEIADHANGPVKNLLSTIHEFSGRELMVQSLRNIFEGVVSIVTPLKEAFRDIFPPITVQQLYNFIAGIEKLTSKLKLSEETSENLKRTFKGIFAVADILKQAFTAVFNAIKPLFGSVGGFAGGILEITANFGDWLVKLNETIKTTNIFNEIMQTVSKYVGIVANEVRYLYNVIKEKLVFPSIEFFHGLLERIHTRMGMVSDAASDMKSGVSIAVSAMGKALANSKFLTAMQVLWDGIKIVGSALGSIFRTLTGGFIDKIANADFSGILDFINTLIAGGIGVGILKFEKILSDLFGGFGDVAEGLTGILDGVKNSFEAIQNNLNAGAIRKIAVAIAILAAALLVISLVDSEKLSVALGSVTVLFADLMASLAVFAKLSGGMTGVTKACGAMVTMSVAILILAGALQKVGSLNFGQMATGLVGVAGLMAVVIATMKILGNDKTIIKGALQMVVMAAAIDMLASVCADLSKIPFEGLKKGLIGVGVLMAEVAAFLFVAKFGSTSVKAAAGMLVMAFALKELAKVCAYFGDLDWEATKQGLKAVGILLAETAVFGLLTSKSKHILSTSIALIGMGYAMTIFAEAVQSFGIMQWDKIERGLGAMAGALAAVTIAVHFMPKNIVSIGVGLIAVSAAMTILADALTKMGSMEWENIKRAGAVFAGSLILMAGALFVMSKSVAGTVALFAAVGAMAALVPILSILGAMSWEAIIKGLGAIAGAFTVLGLAGLLLKPLAPTILSLAASLVLTGVGMAAIGAGILLVGAGLSAVAVGVTALVGAIAAGAASIVASLTVIVTGVAKLIPAIVEILGELIIRYCNVIAEGAPAIGKAVKALVLTLIDVIVECVPALAVGVLDLITGVLAAVVDYVPQIVELGLQFLIKVLEGIAKHIPTLIKKAMDLISAFFGGVVDALRGIDADTMLKGLAGVGLLAGIMLALSAVSSLIPGAMVGVLGMGVVIAELALVLAAIGGIAQIPGLNWLITEGGKFLENIGVAIGSFIGGIVGGIMGGITSQFPAIGQDLSDFMTNIQPFIEGAEGIDPKVMDGVKALASAILVLTAANIIDGIASWITGGSSLSSFAQDLVPFGYAMRDFSYAIAGMDANLVAGAATAGKALAEMAATIPNSGGLVSFFSGENDMVEFAQKLVPFGMAMRLYSQAVSGMDAQAVVNSATAGKALTEMANTVPNCGGLVSFFTGENDIVAFAQQLIPFGMAMRMYGMAVSGMDVESVVNSATAGKALTELANTIPNCGGLVSFFTGENDMAAFGTKLVSFGGSFKQYSELVKDIDAGVVTATSNAADSIVTLANSLPENKLFKNETTLDEFGKQLSKFGGYFADYYKEIEGIALYKLTGVITELNRLLDLARSASGIDFEGLSGFGKALKDLGKAGIDALITEFDGGADRVLLAMTDMFLAMNTSINTNAQTIVTSFTAMIDKVIKLLNQRKKDFADIGKALMTNFISGIKSKTQDVKMAILSIVSAAATEIRNHYTKFYDAGVYLGDGLAAGIESCIKKVAAKARAMVRAAIAAAEEEAEIDSPSKITTADGEFFGMGFVNGIDAYVDKAYKSGASLAEKARTGLSEAISTITDAINGDLDVQPTIRPVLDLSDVRSKAGSLNAMLSRSQAMSISTGLNRSASETIQNGETKATNGTVYSFTQNNYSPKALSRVEIYRQTKNQFSAIERMGTV